MQHVLPHERFGLPSFSDTLFLVFGYGSILWKQNFDFDEVYDVFIKGHKRVFYQGTCAHRGVPGAPGRVVTLLPAEDEEARVYGRAYQLPTDPEKLMHIFEMLDQREDGYDRVQLTLFDAHTGSEECQELHIHLNPEHQHRRVVCLCYIATEANDDYLGEQPMEVMAQQIICASGPSGTNEEYLFFLAKCLREMGAQDEHVYELEATAKQLIRQQRHHRGNGFGSHANSRCAHLDSLDTMSARA